MSAQTIPVHFVRAALRGVQRAGREVAPLLYGAGIPGELFDSPKGRIPYDRFAKLVSLVIWELGDELMGLGESIRKPGSFRMMALTMVHGSDFGAGVSRAQAFARLFPGSPQLRLRQEPGQPACLEIGVADTDDPDHFLAESVMTGLHRLCGWLIARRIRLLRAEFPYPAPQHQASYDVLFGCPLRFDSDRAALTFDANVLSAPIVQTEATLQPFLRECLTIMIARRDYGTTVADQARRIMENTLGSDVPTPNMIAAQLAMSPQTLRRQLAELGTSTTEIKEELFRDFAITRLLRGVAVDQISALLGFSAPSAFHRAFRRWTGSTPTSYRTLSESLSTDLRNPIGEQQGPVVRGGLERDMTGTR